MTMLRTITMTSLIALFAAPSLADGHASTAGYALSADGMSLTVMPSIAAPADAMTVSLSTPVRSIAWRPVTGELLGYADGKIVTVDPMTGMTTDTGATFMNDATIGAEAVVAFDFNNAIDAVRAVSSAGDNLVYFPSDFGDDRANSVRRFTDMFYAQEDMSEGVDPLIFANAYTNAIDGMKAESTFQYALDAGANTLVSLANNAGTLTTVGLIKVDGEPVDILPAGGFDIVSPAQGTDEAYAVLQIDGAMTAGLYAIDLETGDASLLSDLGTDDISSFAVSSSM